MKELRSVILATLAGTMFAGISAQAQTSAASTPAAGPCDAELFRQFDFWVGEWEVFIEGGDKVGDNIITKEENGCLLVEHWTDIQGNTGQSYNFVDHHDNQWRQLWVSPGAVIDYVGAMSSPGVIDLEGTLASLGSEPLRYRGTWSKQEDGSVRQHLRHFDTEKDEWAAGFVGIYKPKTASD